MMRITFVYVLVASIVAPLCADQPKQVRSITEAKSVLAVYREDWGWGASGGPYIILAAWPDGHVVWSEDRLQGGPPYQSANVDPQKIGALLALFEAEGMFADTTLNQGHFGVDSTVHHVTDQEWKQAGHDAVVARSRTRQVL